MFEIALLCQSRYPVGRKVVMARAKDFLEKKGMRDVGVSIFICGTRKMRELARRYLRKPEDHEVLSFTYNEARAGFVDFPEEILRLGDVAVCFPLAQNRAMAENKLTDEVIGDLVEHGILHLLGEHHEE